MIYRSAKSYDFLFGLNDNEREVLINKCASPVYVVSYSLLTPIWMLLTAIFVVSLEARGIGQLIAYVVGLLSVAALTVCEHLILVNTIIKKRVMRAYLNATQKNQ